MAKHLVFRAAQGFGFGCLAVMADMMMRKEQSFLADWIVYLLT